MANCATVSYVGYEEVVSSNEKGRGEVYYYLRRCDGGLDLVVVGKERSVKHMSYHYVKDTNYKSLLLSHLNRSSMPKLRSRREVIHWLNTIISGLDQDPNCTLRQFGGGTDTKSDANVIKKAGALNAGFMWLGSPWTCRKKRRHYQSFQRNGFILSVHDFVYVLAEENKRLVAYLDDIYEDSRGNKMVVVRWFHKIDEVGFDLPHIYNDREIFFSLCLQDLSIECIDGLATVLSPEHYEKFVNEATYLEMSPFMCCKQFDNDDFKPLDITTVKGYWRQRILNNNTSSALEPSYLNVNVKVKRSPGDTVMCRPTKKIRWSKESEKYLKPAGKTVSVQTNLQGNLRMASLTDDAKSCQTCIPYLVVGSQVEVLSQDSGIRGCWFRALIIKKHKDKVKVQYQDIKDATDDAKNLEEWVLASRKAATDVLGIWVAGRTIIRPTSSPDEGRAPALFNVGSIVDAWWHDGWWEGIIVRKESEDRLHVHFLGETQEHIFGAGDLRHSQEWFENKWRSINGRPEISSKLAGLGKLIKTDQSADHEAVAPSGLTDLHSLKQDDFPQKVIIKVGSIKNEKIIKEEEPEPVRDLSKDCLLAQLKWKASGKRRRPRSLVHVGASNFSGIQTCERFFVGSSPFVNGFSSSMVSTLANLVMSS